MKLLLLILLAQQQVNIVPVDLAAIRQPDGGVVQVVGGTWFSKQEVINMGKDHAYLRKEAEHLEEHAPDVPYQWVAGAAGVGIVIGVVTGYFAARAVPR